MRIFRYWGKQGPADVDGKRFHLLPFHCLDVAATCRVLLAGNRSLVTQISGLLQVNPEVAQGLFPFLACLHDLGKFCPAFQHQKPWIVEKLKGPGGNSAQEIYHDEAGYVLWMDAVARGELIPAVVAAGDRIKDPTSSLRSLVSASTHHHGSPPGSPDPVLLDTMWR
jgi:CRISPR-associated endonuclease/helicase Cas3